MVKAFKSLIHHTGGTKLAYGYRFNWNLKNEFLKLCWKFLKVEIVSRHAFYLKKV